MLEKDIWIMPRFREAWVGWPKARLSFDRDEVIERAWELLDTSNLLLLAPRRVGKSSLLNRMKEEGLDRGYKTLYLSVPDAEDELDFIKRLTRVLD